MALKLVFMGTPDFSVPVLDAVHAAGHDIVAVYAQPARPAGRGMAAKPSPVAARAEALGFPVLTPLNFRDEEDRAAFQAHNADAAVVVAYGLLLPREIIDAPRLGCFNVHASRLPRWRGAAPIQRAIMAGDTETAVAIMRMDAGLDTGPVAMTRALPITPETTAGDLHDALSRAGAALMVETLVALEAGPLALTAQPTDGVTYAKKIDKSEARLDFSVPAPVVAHTINGLSPFPGAWCEIGDANNRERVKILRADVIDGIGQSAAVPGTIIDDDMAIACAAGAIRPVQVQRAGRKPVTRAEFLRGFPLPKGSKLF